MKKQTEPQAPSRVDRMNAKTTILTSRMSKRHARATLNHLGGELRECLPAQGTPITEQELRKRIAKQVRKWLHNVEHEGTLTGAVMDLEQVTVEYPLKRGKTVVK